MFFYFCYLKLFWPFTVWINCSSDLKNFAKFSAFSLEFQKLSRSLEQFFLTVGQNNFGNKILFPSKRHFFSHEKPIKNRIRENMWWVRTYSMVLMNDRIQNWECGLEQKVGPDWPSQLQPYYWQNSGLLWWCCKEYPEVMEQKSELFHQKSLLWHFLFLVYPLLWLHLKKFNFHYLWIIYHITVAIT